MQANTTLFRLGLSSAGGLITGLLGMLLGLAWAVALDIDRLVAALALAALAFVWGAISVQLTPTGGVIVDNRTTVNYALLVTYAWIAAFGCIAAAVVYGLRVTIL